ncbi:hypothetical protein ACFWA9_38255 [Kitasatospora sp. NPDC059973]|uniref:hypothetical protein n=1 Tax=Kitasatospora sp. NPDC059973 TaxID=3347020 RepID=UPI0036A71544
MSSQRPPLITEHWFREGPIQPDGSDGYWICGWPGCGQHRADHAQAEGQWLLSPHPFQPQRIAPSRCYTCGYHWRHTRHVPWRWDQWSAPTRRDQPAPTGTAHRDQ